MSKKSRKLPLLEKNKPVPSARNIFLVDRTKQKDIKEEDLIIFFSSLRLKNKTFKTTLPHRLDDLNQIVTNMLPHIYRPLRIMDVGISSGISTLEWMYDMEIKKISFVMTATDLTMYANIISIGKFFHVLTEKNGYPLQYEIFNQVIPSFSKIGLYLLRPLYLLFYFIVEKITSGILMKRIKGFVSCVPIKLLHPAIMISDSIELDEDNLLGDQRKEWIGYFDVIRAANLLNKVYFDKAVIKCMLKNLRSRLVENGIMIICRTYKNGTNHGSIFKLNIHNKFEAISDIGYGSEIKDLVVALD